MAAAGSASAATIVGFGAPVSNPALAGGTVVDFTGLSTGNFLQRTIGDFTIASVGGLITINDSFNGAYNATGRSANNGNTPGVPITFTFANAVSAFGFNMGAHDNTWTVRAFAGNTLVQTVSIAPIHGSNAGQYYGATGAGITRAELTNTGSDYVIFDNITYVTSAAVPEPATWAMMIAGFGGAGAVLRRRRAQTA